MSKMQLLLTEFLTERLSAMAVEITEAVAKAIGECQEETSRAKEENVRLLRLVNFLYNPGLKLHKIDSKQPSPVCSKEQKLPPQRLKWSNNTCPSLNSCTQGLYIYNGSQDEQDSSKHYSSNDQDQFNDKSHHEPFNLPQPHNQTFENKECDIEPNNEQFIVEPSNEQLIVEPNQIKVETGEHEFDGSEHSSSSRSFSPVFPDCSIVADPNAVLDSENSEVSALEFSKSNDGQCLSQSLLVQETTEFTIHESASTEQAQSIFNCPVCGKSFKRISFLKMHYKMHTRALAMYRCHICGKCYANEANLNSHISDHTATTTEQQCQCNQCDQCLTRWRSVFLKSGKDSVKRPYFCFCGKSFTRKDSLVWHRRIHTGEKPHKCQECAKCFTQKAHLISHMRTHTGEKPYVCSFCSMGFAHKVSLKGHLKRYHPTKMPVYSLNLISDDGSSHPL